MRKEKWREYQYITQEIYDNWPSNLQKETKEVYQSKVNTSYQTKVNISKSLEIRVIARKDGWYETTFYNGMRVIGDEGRIQDLIREYERVYKV